MFEIERVKMEEIKNPERFDSSLSFAAEAVSYATEKIREILPGFVHRYPSACSENLKYHAVANSSGEWGSDWTAGFWTGMLWLAYELTGNELFRGIAEAQYDDYKKRYTEYDCLNHHDIGFIYVPSIVAQYKVTHAAKAKKLAFKAAKQLSKRYSEKARIIQVRDWRSGQGEFIIDCCMNLPLLFWAGKETGDRSYYIKAMNHLSRAVECMVRADASTYQCFKIDEITGEKAGGWQGQGYVDESCWARGQAWIMYGLAVAYTYCLDKDILKMAKRVSNYFLNRLPDDQVCNWDLYFTQNDAQRDTSAAAPAACGLLELSKWMEPEEWKIYKDAAVTILRSLAENYSTKGKDSNGLLTAGVYCKDKGSGGLGDNECCIWGDYFYLEGLTRLSKDWVMYW